MKNYSLLVHGPEELKTQLNKITKNQCTHYLVQIFSTQSSDVSLLYSRTIQDSFHDSIVLGLSASHLIFRGEIVNHGTLVLITELFDCHLSSAAIPVSGNNLEDSELLIHSLELREDCKSVIAFSDGITADDANIFECFNHLESTVPVSGGISFENQHGRWVILNGQVYTNSVIAVAINCPHLSTTFGSFSQWNPIGKKFKVTEAQGPRTISLDDYLTTEIYNKYLSDGLSTPLSDISNFPLMKGKKSAQNIHVPQAVNSDGSIEFTPTLNVGDEVRFCYNHPTLTIEQVQLEAIRLREFNPTSLFVYNCTSRLDFMKGSEEIQPLTKIVEVNGVFCGGEIGRDKSKQTIMHHSMTYLAMREGNDKPYANKRFPAKVHSISPLFSLIRNAIADADEMHHELEQRYTLQAQALTESYRIDHRTNLFNRSVLKERLSEMNLSEHLITMKLNNFPQINEKYGYEVGDQLLLDISSYCELKLKETLGEHSILYSIGTGEWAAVFNSHSSGVTLRKKISQFAEQIEHVDFHSASCPDLGHLSVSVSVGITSRRDYPEISTDSVLLKSIEARRFATKHNRHVFSAKQMEAENTRRQSQLQWLSRVSRAVLNKNVIAYTQPILEAHTHKEVAVECLVRIRDEGRIITPGQFLPIIEGTHLYTRLSRQMLKHTFSVMKDKATPFSINLSPQDLMNDRTIQQLEKYLLTINNPARVGLEVLETEQIHDYGRMIEVCNHLRALGARIIIDDFGSGYSNIDEIIKLEPQIVKIDGSLIRSIDTDLRQRKVAQTLIQLCGVFGAKTVAEFVHNKEVCKVAEDLGVDYLQGYYLGEPYQPHV